MVFNIEVGKSAMDVCANLLSRWSSAKDSDDWDFGWDFFLRRRASILLKLRIEFCGVSLVMVDAVEADSKDVHVSSSTEALGEQTKGCIMMRRKENSG